MRKLPAFFALASLSACAPTADRNPSDGADADTTDATPTPDTSPADTSDSSAPDTADPSTRDTANHDTANSNDPCAGLVVCDDFEDTPPGGAPDAERWAVVSPDCSGAGALVVDDTQAYSGTHSLRVDGGGGYCDHVFARVALPAVGVVHVTFAVRFAAAFGSGHTSFVSMPDTRDGSPLRMGGQAGILMWNRASDDATLPVLSPAGIATSLAPEAGRWYRVAFTVDPAGTLSTWVDDQPIEGLLVDGVPTPEIDERWLRAEWLPTAASVDLGWESYAGQAMTLWLDDITVRLDPASSPP